LIIISVVAEGNRAMIRQVLVHLLPNAIKFKKEKEIGVIEIGDRTEDQSIYYVKDNGVEFYMEQASQKFCK
jgi:light-regulated signal transduction histidine kinase (bacteriophytochrome)